ncbi:hypothetical protein M408DRAFT_171719 [Serendipita vermifera MAFF 305830]|uniref:Uncharacterized protein n=1 Tax=Serendipita vermifera MAFF 305830 TaxID=933852 RepID=A0A0C2WLS8_SERVB|nr:hypothetical protein M408DRAFT_171719 [Serendipita vermifera MAFF 305830]
MIDPKSLSGDEKQRRAQRKKAMNSAEMQKRKADLLKFSSSFKLSEPIPEDLIPILAKDETKQTAIREKHTVRPTTRALDRDRTKADLLAFSNNSKLSEPMEVDLTDTSLDVRDRTSSDATSPQNSTTDTNVPPRGQSPSEPSAGEETYIDEEDQSVPPTNETPPGETPKGMDMWERQNDEEPMLKADSQVAAQVNIGANADTDTEKKAEDVSPKTPPLQKEEQEIYLDTKRAEEIEQVVHLPPSAGPTLSTNPQSFEGNGIDNENPRSAPQIQKEELTFRKRIFDGNYSDVHCAEWQGQMVFRNHNLLYKLILF